MRRFARFGVIVIGLVCLSTPSVRADDPDVDYEIEFGSPGSGGTAPVGSAFWITGTVQWPLLKPDVDQVRVLVRKNGVLLWDDLGDAILYDAGVRSVSFKRSLTLYDEASYQAKILVYRNGTLLNSQVFDFATQQ
jgi:hypothetical protein